MDDTVVVQPGRQQHHVSLDWQRAHRDADPGARQHQEPAHPEDRMVSGIREGRALGCGKSDTSIEMSMMLDVTGSMKGDKFTDMKAAATDLVNIVLAPTTGANTVKIGIVPFAEGVRLPSSANATARGTPADLALRALHGVEQPDEKERDQILHLQADGMRRRAHGCEQVHRCGAGARATMC